MILARYQIEERMSFTREQKNLILEKSNCKCAKCGMHLTIDGMTTDHIIPLSKGGTNNSVNLVALCYDCNQDKSNYVLHPLDYYGYVKKEHMVDIVNLYHNYLNDVPWFGRRNYTKEDKKLFYYTQHLGQIRKMKSGDYMTRGVKQSITFERVYIDEINEIYDFVKDYNDRYDIDSNGLMEYLEEIFNRGCIYKLYSKSAMIAVLPFTIESFDIDLEDARHDKMDKLYKVKLSGIPNKYQKEQYASVIAEAITYVLYCLSELNHLNVTICVTTVPKSDDYLHKIVRVIQGRLCATSDTWDYYTTKFVSPDIVTESDGMFMYDQLAKMEYEKVEEVVSDGLERRLHLPSLHKKQEKAERQQEYKEKVLQSKSKKKNKRPKQEYDEYDLEYYQ